MCQFFKALNAIFSKVGRFASEAVVLNLICTKCLLILLYAVDSCPLVGYTRQKVAITVTRSLMKLFKTGSLSTIISDCQKFFGFLPITYQIDIRTARFLETLLWSMIMVFARCSNVTPKLVEIKFSRTSVTSIQCQTWDVPLMNCFSVSHS